MTDPAYLASLVYRLRDNHTLAADEYETLLRDRNPETASLLAAFALVEKQKIYGNDVYVRGLIEVSNICVNDCLYCGIRRSNKNCDRYRLTEAEILECCAEGYALGFRTFVMQGGEDGSFSDDFLVPLIREIKTRWSDCAVTLSLGERSRESYEKLKQAGADRYLLRHETADADHYSTLHPASLSWQNRMDCLYTLQEMGYQVGCGFMVGSPGQTVAHLVKDLQFIERFQPDMCGIGPFIPHKDTPFHDCPAGSVELTLYLLSILRLIQPTLLLPATTALGTLLENGREKGILSGANVVMPNLSPASVRRKYLLYNNKLSDGAESAQAVDTLKKRMESIGAHVVVARGDIIK